MVAAVTCEYHRRLRDPQIDWGRSPEWWLRHQDYYSERSWLVDIVVVVVVFVVVVVVVVDDDDDDENGDGCCYYYCP